MTGRELLIKKMIAALLASTACQAGAENGSWDALRQEVEKIGKPEWRPMLIYVAKLHERATHEPVWPFELPWEEIGPGYIYGPAFGHWDIIHQVVDTIPTYPRHALHQLLNSIANQEPHGLVPGAIWMPGGRSQRGKASWNKGSQGHPPVWVHGVQRYMDTTADEAHLPEFLDALVKQIKWFETCRKAEGEGFYYTDITRRKWESGVDDGVRFDNAPRGEFACIDATCHAYWLYKHAITWAKELGKDSAALEKREAELKTFIQNDLYCRDDGVFYDTWAVKDETLRSLCYESIWPIVTGAAVEEQALWYIDNYLMNPDVFFTKHPIATVGKRDPKFELRMFRGCAWNSMTYWAMIGCLNYERNDDARQLAERALDDTAEQFDRTGTLWEFYHPDGGRPEDLLRKRGAKPCTDYLGHNPVIEMTRIYDRLAE